MDIAIAKELVKNYGVQIEYDKNLSMWAVILNDMIEYIPTKEFEELNESDFLTVVAHKMMIYAATKNTTVRLH